MIINDYFFDFIIANPGESILMTMDQGQGRLINRIGETTLGQYLGLLKNADACIGFPAGNTILGPALGTKTGLIWNDKFPKQMHINACKPNTSYVAYNTKDNPKSISADFIRRVLSD